MMDAAGLRHPFGKVRDRSLGHVVIPLMGRFKGKTGSRHNLQGVVNKKASKLKVRWWLESLNDYLISQGQINGLGCCDEEGNSDQDSQYQATFVHFLTEIQQERPDIILGDVNFGEDYVIGRSFGRGAGVRELNTRVPQPGISSTN